MTINADVLQGSVKIQIGFDFGFQIFTFSTFNADACEIKNWLMSSLINWTTQFCIKVV